MQESEEFYSKAVNYWAKVPATIDGMLGGYGHISQIDISGSKTFLHRILKSKNPPDRCIAVDCGAGIGRISKYLLLNIFQKVDLVEQNSTFLEQAKKYVGVQAQTKIGSLFAVGLQNFKPEPNHYDVIWVQWVLGHLTESDFISFFASCKLGLKPNGVIIVKENITSSGETEIDEQDSSVTRPISLLRALFTEAGLNCYLQLKQPNFPRSLYMVYMFALRPLEIEKPHENDELIKDDENSVVGNVEDPDDASLHLNELGECLESSQTDNVPATVNIES